MRTLIQNLTLTGTIMLVASCGGSDAENSSDPNNLNKTVNDIQGDWLWSCDFVSDQNLSASYQIHEKYDSGNYTGVYNIYSTEDCTGDVQATNTATGTYTLGADFDTDDSPSLRATEIDFDLPSVMTTGDNDLLQLVNPFVVWGTGGQFYDIFYINNSQLYWGIYTSENNGTTAEKRPTEINLSGPAISI